MVFEGHELLEYLLPPIRKEIDFISVVYQEKSFFDNQCADDLISTLEKLLKVGLIDKMVKYNQNSLVRNKINEINNRNIGRQLSIDAGCTHHISADTDEFYLPEQLSYAKKESEGYDCSMAYTVNYYKEPTYKIVPDQNHIVTLIHPVENYYDISANSPYSIEITRKLEKMGNIKLFTKNEFSVHHMTYVRRDIRAKLINSPSGKLMKIDKFIDAFNKYKLGDRLCIPPDFMNRKTELTPNIFNIKELNGSDIN